MQHALEKQSILKESAPMVSATCVKTYELKYSTVGNRGK